MKRGIGVTRQMSPAVVKHNIGLTARAVVHATFGGLHDSEARLLLLRGGPIACSSATQRRGARSIKDFKSVEQEIVRLGTQLRELSR